jgi:hypothetical protein
MTWHDAHRYNSALRAVETELDRTGDGEIRWRPEYAQIFGSPRGLLLALRSRWQTMLHAQVEDEAGVDGRASDELQALVDRHPGLVHALVRAGVMQPATTLEMEVGAA